ncbi:MAG: MCE family protein, partial [Verrucomicrobia bacterium]|nr:MCE family protein [Verrucomicrobiota bacterium]
MNEQARNVIIGVFVLAAICLVVWLVLFLHPTVGDEQKILRVRFTNIEKVSIGTRVTFAGRPVGQVIAINQIYDARQKAQPETERIYFFELVLAVDSSVHVYNTDQIVLHTLGLFGEKSIAIIPRNPPPGVVPVEITNQVIYAKSGDQMQDVFSEFTNVAAKAGKAFDQISALLDEKQG